MKRRRVPRPLARRLDRLARGAHLFHRYAHHPLCAAYAAETVRLGRRARLCRGCAGAALGAAVGAAAAFALPVPPGAALLAGAALLGPALLAAVRPRGGAGAAGAPAGGKLLTRGAPACAAAALALSGLRAASPAGLAAAALALAAAGWAVRAYRRRGPDRRRCEACPERALPRTCSGFAPIARREAAFGRAAGRLLRAVPPQPRAR
ncbi:hypothetical protein [Anaeromyxobacter diazotrophicus]|uniref:Uncharacterized protein n=1 Tax=Anaeromyxobacter diazotrophicus TaxID=2590199 RepID=A0A7I9VPL3_9BACT|nr:hypothetical protein [Anaeromyxobacter diazotrophicus]GEJ58178.1 hypothetical protein AMYX_29190 [Anaeromyxobacter diazotrophicus]